MDSFNNFPNLKYLKVTLEDEFDEDYTFSKENHTCYFPRLEEINLSYFGRVKRGVHIYSISSFLIHKKFPQN